MPNGVSCAYFAARNHIYGKSENNVFKEGIAGIQSVRTVDAVTSSATASRYVSAPIKGFFSKLASIGRKIVYPLIIASGVYNTVKSEDKVKTGVMQGAGIGTMYAFETLCEKGLKHLNNKVMSTNFVKNNKYARYAWYAAKGMTFVAASLAGYNTGSKIGEKSVDAIRGYKKVENYDTKEKKLFEDMIL